MPLYVILLERPPRHCKPPSTLHVDFPPLQLQENTTDHNPATEAFVRRLARLPEILPVCTSTVEWTIPKALTYWDRSTHQVRDRPNILFELGNATKIADRLTSEDPYSTAAN